MDIKDRSHLIDESFAEAFSVAIAEAFSGARHDIPLQRNVPPMPVIPRKCGKIQMMINAAYQQGKAEGRKELIDKVIDAIKDLESIKGGYQDLALRTKMPQRRDYIKRMEAIGLAIHLFKERLEIKEEQEE